MTQPKISVIVPVYKVEAYLEKCVESIRNQTYQNLEIILVDDGSPDRCGEMCDEFAKIDPRIRVVHKENGGLSSARNAGLDAMTGDYVGFVDSDDYIASDMYQTLFALLLENKAQIACGGIERVTAAGHYDYFNNALDEEFVLDCSSALGELIRNYRVTNSLCDKLFSKEIFLDLRMTEGIVFEDYDVMYRCIAKAERVCYIAKPLYFYFMSGESILRTKSFKKHFDVVLVGEKRIAFYEKNCREHLLTAKGAYAENCVNLIYLSRHCSESVQLRKNLIRKMREFLKCEKNLPFRKPVQLKMFLFRISVPLFTCVQVVYDCLKKSNR